MFNRWLFIVLAVGLGAFGSITACAAPGGKAGAEVGVTRMRLVVDPYQAAFYMLVPQAWRTEGGMRPSGADWNKLDLVESNISFRATSPDGGSRFGWFPRFYFIDPTSYVRSSGGMLNAPVGGVMDGAWVYPPMGVEDFARHIVFRQFAPKELGNARLTGRFVEVPELRKLAPQVARRRSAVVATASTVVVVVNIVRLVGVLAIGAIGDTAELEHWHDGAGVVLAVGVVLCAGGWLLSRLWPMPQASRVPVGPTSLIR